MEGKAVEDESISFMRFLSLLFKSVWVCKIVYHQVDQEENTSQSYEASQPCGNPAEVTGKVEEHVDPLHGIGRSCLLKVLLDAPKVENTNQKPQRQQPAEDRVDGVKRGNREIGNLHDCNHLEGDNFAHSEEKGDEHCKDGKTHNDVGGNNADVVQIVLVI